MTQNTETTPNTPNDTGREPQDDFGGKTGQDGQSLSGEGRSYQDGDQDKDKLRQDNEGAGVTGDETRGKGDQI